MADTLEQEYITYQEMESLYFTNRDVPMTATLGAVDAVGMVGVTRIFNEAFLYGAETVGNRCYVLQFRFETQPNSNVSHVKIVDGNLDVVKDNLVIETPGHSFSGCINIKESWNGRVRPVIPDEHYICVYLPCED